jgi:hypothetical protein
MRGKDLKLKFRMCVSKLAKPKRATLLDRHSCRLQADRQSKSVGPCELVLDALVLEWNSARSRNG